MNKVASDSSFPEDAASRGEAVMVESLTVRMIDPVIVQWAYAANADALKAMEAILWVDEAC